MADADRTRFYTVPATLSRAEQLAFARRAVLDQIRAMPGVLRARLGRGAPDSALDTLRPPPDTAAAGQAVEFVERAYGADLLNHCLRCWYFGDLFGRLAGLPHDAELLYVASLLHDIGLTDEHRAGPADPPCFALQGAQVARAGLVDWGKDDSFAERAAAAIALHMEVQVTVAEGVEAHLLHAAAHLDVTGARADELPGPALRATLARHPRGDFEATFLHAMRDEAHVHPRSRTAALWASGMRIPVVLNPLRSMS